MISLSKASVKVSSFDVSCRTAFKYFLRLFSGSCRISSSEGVVLISFFRSRFPNDKSFRNRETWLTSASDELESADGPNSKGWASSVSMTVYGMCLQSVSLSLVVFSVHIDQSSLEDHQVDHEMLLQRNQQ